MNEQGFCQQCGIVIAEPLPRPFKVPFPRPRLNGTMPSELKAAWAKEIDDHKVR